jgi:hypothetical protein
MSFEGGVMPTEVTLDVALVRVTPKPGKGALGAWRFHRRPSYPDAAPGFYEDDALWNEVVGKPYSTGCMRADA